MWVFKSGVLKLFVIFCQINSNEPHSTDFFFIFEWVKRSILFTFKTRELSIPEISTNRWKLLDIIYKPACFYFGLMRFGFNPSNSSDKSNRLIINVITLKKRDCNFHYCNKKKNKPVLCFMSVFYI